MNSVLSPSRSFVCFKSDCFKNITGWLQYTQITSQEKKTPKSFVESVCNQNFMEKFSIALYHWMETSESLEVFHLSPLGGLSCLNQRLWACQMLNKTVIMKEKNNDHLIDDDHNLMRSREEMPKIWSARNRKMDFRINPFVSTTALQPSSPHQRDTPKRWQGFWRWSEHQINQLSGDDRLFEPHWQNSNFHKSHRNLVKPDDARPLKNYENDFFFPPAPKIIINWWSVYFVQRKGVAPVKQWYWLQWKYWLIFCQKRSIWSGDESTKDVEISRLIDFTVCLLILF